MHRVTTPAAAASQSAARCACVWAAFHYPCRPCLTGRRAVLHHFAAWTKPPPPCSLCTPISPHVHRAAFPPTRAAPVTRAPHIHRTAHVLLPRCPRPPTRP
ncbi:hypothetical protein HYPSUDRAFT_203635 [Hypholoma sublateritium FD-334 SS-4]|uniref:Uncharacterized protein n=1 Tax=Hypholoma sublateritium (strain FD-334 SS-4) TaxID=945553 RepID=A0A0D2NPE8_HYPSF|nr:hypothetical protein HYPSUDRAFT_203635 [Hypholoma sublateritium FD-334 SS-4]